MTHSIVHNTVIQNIAIGMVSVRMIVITSKYNHGSKRDESSEDPIVTRIPTPTPTIPVTVDTFQALVGAESPKATTVTRIAGLFLLIPNNCFDPKYISF